MPSERTLKILEGMQDLYPSGYDPFLDDVEQCGRSMYYDREGEPISFRQWSMLFNIKDYQRIEFTEVGVYHVSTIWIGLDHNVMGTAPLIFESMVFSSGLSWSKPLELNGTELPGFQYHESLDCRRYATEEQALQGHQELCEEVRLMHEALSATDPREVGR